MEHLSPCQKAGAHTMVLTISSYLISARHIEGVAIKTIKTIKTIQANIVHDDSLFLFRASVSIPNAVAKSLRPVLGFPCWFFGNNRF